MLTQRGYPMPNGVMSSPGMMYPMTQYYAGAAGNQNVQTSYMGPMPVYNPYMASYLGAQQYSQISPTGTSPPGNALTDRSSGQGVPERTNSVESLTGSFKQVQVGGPVRTYS